MQLYVRHQMALAALLCCCAIHDPCLQQPLQCHAPVGDAVAGKTHELYVEEAEGRNNGSAGAPWQLALHWRAVFSKLGEGVHWLVPIAQQVWEPPEQAVATQSPLSQHMPPGQRTTIPEEQACKMQKWHARVAMRRPQAPNRPLQQTSAPSIGRAPPGGLSAMHSCPNTAHRAACAVNLADVLVAVIPAAERGAAILGAVTVVTPMVKQAGQQRSHSAGQHRSHWGVAAQAQTWPIDSQA